MDTNVLGAPLSSGYRLKHLTRHKHSVLVHSCSLAFTVFHGESRSLSGSMGIMHAEPVDGRGIVVYWLATTVREIQYVVDNIIRR